jgi:lipid II:glycine glycyltransferase (peptidoglycan interpeptide bridge formation enzyme)
MLEIELNRAIFKKKEVWFSDSPFDVKGYDSVVFYCCKTNVAEAGFEKAEQTTLIIDLADDLAVIWRHLEKSSCRYAISRAERDGVEPRVNRDYDEFLKLNRSFRKRKALAAGTETMEFMKSYGTLFTAFLDGEMLAGQFYLQDNNHMRWLLGATSRLEVNAEKATLVGNANKFLTWQAIRYAKQMGIREFDMGGYYVGEEMAIEMRGINAFKASFGGKLATRYAYRKDYSRLYRLARWLYEVQQGRGAGMPLVWVRNPVSKNAQISSSTKHP